METIEGNTGCLIVQGVNSQKQQMNYSITYLRQGKRWLIEDVTVAVYDSGQTRWLTEPVCDVERAQQLWLKQLQGG